MLLEKSCGTLQQFLFPLTVDEFLDNVLTGGFRRIDGDAVPSRLELLGSDPARVLIKAFHLAPKLTFHSANPLGPPPSLLSIHDESTFRKRIEQFHSRNYSVRFPELRALSPALDALVRALEIVLHQPVTASAFWSCGGMKAPVHCDDHDLIVVQLRGAKRWFISKTPSELNNTWTPIPVRAAVLGAHETLDLVPGDLVYLPRGTLHSVESNAESLHLSIGFTPLTVRDAMIAALDHLSDLDQTFRMTAGARLAFQLRGEGLEKLYPAIFDGIGRLFAACKQPGFLAAALQRRSARSVSALHSLPRPERPPVVTLDTVVRHGETSFCYLTANSEIIDFSYPGGHEYIHLGAIDSLLYIVNTPTFRVGDIDGEIDDEVRLSLASKLLAIGFLQL
jgi:hypothetical protein